MTAGFEIYAPNGELLLSNKTMVTIKSDTIAIGRGTAAANTNTMDDMGGWFDVSTSSWNTGGSTSFISAKRAVGAVDDQVWYRPFVGTSCYVLSDDLIAVANAGDIQIAKLKDTYPTSSDGFLSVYDESGKLMWSVGALQDSCVVVDKIDLMNKSKVIIDLDSYGKDLNKLFISSTYLGALAYADEGFSFIRALGLTRIGNKVHCSIVTLSSSYYVDPVNFPVTIFVGCLP